MDRSGNPILAVEDVPVAIVGNGEPGIRMNLRSKFTALFRSILEGGPHGNGGMVSMGGNYSRGWGGYHSQVRGRSGRFKANARKEARRWRRKRMKASAR